MRVWPGAAVSVLALAVAACSSPLGPKYEYEEQMYLRVDGSITVVVDSSLPALVALRGLPINTDPRARVDRNEIRQAYLSGGCADVRVGQPWVRERRHFIQIRLEAKDMRTLNNCGPLSWSTYAFEKDDTSIKYQQQIGQSAGKTVASAGWNGGELVGFKLHVPSKVLYHNVRRLKDGSTGEVERGNILTYEQTLKDRLAGAPISIDVHLGAQSILLQTLWLFGGAFVAALLVMATLIWWTMRRGRKRAPIGQRRVS